MKTAAYEKIVHQAEKVFQSSKPVLITRNGEPIGYFRPLPDPSAEPLEVRRRRFQKIGAKIRQHLDARGITEEQVDRDVAEVLRKARSRR